jgi:hypothetical protein
VQVVDPEVWATDDLARWIPKEALNIWTDRGDDTRPPTEKDERALGKQVDREPVRNVSAAVIHMHRAFLRFVDVSLTLVESRLSRQTCDRTMPLGRKLPSPTDSLVLHFAVA